MKLKNKIVLITGASSGIGEACAVHFAREEADLILLARREDRLLNLTNEINKKYGTKTFSITEDVRNYASIKNVIDNLPEEWKSIDILINNAGLAIGFEKFFDADPQNWNVMIDTNVKGVLHTTRAVIQGMIERQKGHIINIGSTAGHDVYPNGNVYCATKFAVDALTKSMRIELLDKNIKVSTVDPGLVETEFSIVRFEGDKEKANNVYSGLNPLTANDIAETIIFVATRPDHVNIGEIIVMPKAQASSLFVHKISK